jgi:hypothetical protein
LPRPFEFLGFTEDGNQAAWTGRMRVMIETPPRLVRHATVRHLLEATETFFELESGPIDGTAQKPGPEVAKWEAWKKAHALVKPCGEGARRGPWRDRLSSRSAVSASASSSTPRLSSAPWSACS